MANGYVHPFMRGPHPFLSPQNPFQRRFPLQPLQQQPLHYSPNPNTPSALFAPRAAHQAQQAQCLFPNAFPAEGPNIFQRFWIRLFHFLMAPFYLLWHSSKHLANAAKDIASRAHVEWARYTDPDTDLLTLFLYENSWSIIIGLVVVVVLSVLAWFFSPK